MVTRFLSNLNRIPNHYIYVNIFLYYNTIKCIAIIFSFSHCSINQFYNTTLCNNYNLLRKINRVLRIFSRKKRCSCINIKSIFFDLFMYHLLLNECIFSFSPYIECCIAIIACGITFYLPGSIS